jgi:hypothetical protein
VFVCCECCMLSGRGLCDELITRLEESYRLWCIIVCDLETSRMRRPWPELGRSATAHKTTAIIIGLTILIIILFVVLNECETWSGTETYAECFGM